MTVDAIPLAVGQTTKFPQYFVKPSKENEKNTLQKQNKRVKKNKTKGLKKKSANQSDASKIEIRFKTICTVGFQIRGVSLPTTASTSSRNISIRIQCWELNILEMPHQC